MILELKIINFNDNNILNKILEWRNDEQTRYYSNNCNIITKDIFEIIINKYKESNISPLIIYLDNIEVGIITFVKNNDKIYIGINIDKNYRNMKIGSNALEYFIKNKNILINNNFRIYALVKNNNMSSINLFSKYFTPDTECMNEFLNNDDNNHDKIFYLDI